MRNAIFMGMEPKQGLLGQSVIVHKLREGGSTWMTSLPQEVEQCQRQLERAHGHVLVGGLGIGLALAVLVKNKNVKTITCVELNKDVCELVWDNFMYSPEAVSFRVGNSRFGLSLMNQDLFEYLKIAKGFEAEFDFAFYDIWCPTGQTVLTTHVLPLRRLSQGIVKQENIECWNEDEMLGQVRMSIESHIMLMGAYQKYPTMAEITDEKFGKMMKEDFSERIMRQDWEFWYWGRKHKWNREQYKAHVESFMASLKNPAAFDRFWSIDGKIKQ